MREKPNRFVAEKLWSLSPAIRYEINDPEMNLDLAQDHLYSGSLLLYTNHFHWLDVAVIGRFIENNLNLPDEDDSSLNHVYAITARKHLDPKRGIVPIIQSQLVPGFADLKGFNLVTVVQNKPEEREIYPDWKEYNTKSLKTVAKAIRTPGKIVAIAPEGTRSKTGGLIEAQDGIDNLFRLGGKTALALPIALHPYEIKPLVTKTIIEIGKPFSYKELMEDKCKNPNVSETDLMMQRLANLLPEQNRGYYSTNFSST